MTIKFGTDGWRAVISDTFTFNNLRLVSQAIADFVHESSDGSPSVVVGFDTRFLSDRYAAEVAAALGDAPTSQAQFDALVSFHYNTGAIGRATLTRKHIAGDHAGAQAEFARWNRAAGRVLKGLTRRRLAEAALYASKG